MSGDDVCKQSSCMCQACAVSAWLKSMGLSHIQWSHGGGSAWLKSMELSHILWSRGVTASTLDPESSDRGSNPRETFS